MNKSNINEMSAQTVADSNSTAQNQHVCQPNANTNVSGWVSVNDSLPDYYKESYIDRLYEASKMLLDVTRKKITINETKK